MKREYLVGGLVVALLALGLWAFFEGRSEEPEEASESTIEEQGLKAEIQSALKNAATAAETYATENNGSYEGADEEALTEMGLQLPPTVGIVQLDTTQRNYCIVMTQSALPPDHAWAVASYSSDVATPTEADTCS